MKYLTLKLPLTVVAAIVLVCRLTEGCTGRKVLNGEKGIISDGPNEYPRFARCEWLIEAGGPNKTIHLEFKSMATECSFDFLFVYDGRSYSSKMIASLSGDSHPETLTATSGYMLLYLFSDRNYVKAGFEAHYSVLDCPYSCSGHGQCINHTCHCIGYYGQACDKLFCPDKCSGHGTCTLSSNGKKCVCEPGYVGLDCGLSTETEIHSHYWYRVADEDTVSGRTAHTGLFLESTNCLYVFGGFDLNNVLNDLNKYCFEDNFWSQITDGDPWPSARKGHAIAAGVNEGFYIFGGTSLDDTPNAELWFFNTSSDTWLLMATNSSIQPRAVTGHSLTNVDNKWLYLFGGKSREISTLDTIYRIQIPGATHWEQVKIRGGNFPPRRLVGHSTVFHKESRSLIVFGGYSQENGLVSERTRQMHMFNIDDGFWSVIHNKNWEEPNLPFPRAFHSAVIMGNYMVVYGGNTHKHHQLEVCYNGDLYLYHLGCHVWYNDTLGFLRPGKGRFGHVASVANGNQLIIMGGYNGRVLSDLLVYKVSPAIARHKTVVNEDLDHCLDYSSNLRCLNDPDCVYCSNIESKAKVNNNNNNDSTEEQEEENPGCIHRTRTDMCLNGDIQDLKSKRCPGICSVLSTCSACVSQGRGANLTASLPRRRVYNEPCSWCVKQSVCTPRAGQY